MNLLFKTYFMFTSKNYTSQFKVRSRLADFFKHIHPDQMTQAPTKIKQENLRSLKNFNAYMDAVNQEKPIQGKLLKFYISEKTNNKSRKFFSFNLELPQLNAQQVQLTNERAEKLIDDIVNALNNKFRESRNVLEGKKKQKISIQNEVKIQTEQEKLQRLQETTGPYQKNQNRREAEQKQLKNAINAKFMQSQKQNLKLKLRKQMSFANTSTNKPMMWSRILMDESGIYNDYQQILNHLIDPKLIYFDEAIGLAQIQQFKKKLLPGELDRLGVRATQAVIQVCEQMQSYTPPISLFVTNHYSANEIPGFFAIPYNFIPVEFLQKWKQLKNVILQERQKYESYYDYFQELMKQLQKKNNMKVKLPSFKNNQDIASKLLILQRLTKHKLNKLIQINIFDQEDYKIFCNQYKMPQNIGVCVLKSKIFMMSNFTQEMLSNAVDSINGKTVRQQQVIKEA